MGTSVAPVPDKKAAVRHILESLGPRAKEFSDQAIAEAAKQWLVKQTPSVPREPLDDTVPLDQGHTTGTVADMPAPDGLGLKTQHIVSGIAHAVATQIGDMGNALKWSFQQPQPREGASFEEAQSAAQQTAASMQALPPEAQQSIQNGAANLAAFATAPLLGKILPIIPTVTTKATQLLVGEALGGATYGAIRPLGDGETRGESILHDAAIFGLTGGAIAGAGKVAGYYVRKATQDAATVAQATADHTLESSLGPTYDQKVAKALEDYGPRSADPDHKKFMGAVKTALEERDAEQTLGATHDAAKAQAAIDLAVEHTPIASLASPEIQQTAQRLAQTPAQSFDQVTESALAGENPDQLFLEGLQANGHALPQPVHEIPFPVVPGMNKMGTIWQTMNRLREEQWSALMTSSAKAMETAKTVALGPEAGAVSRRMMIAGTGAGSWALGNDIEEQHPFAGSALKAIGMMAMAESAINSPGFRTMFTKEGSWTRKALEAMDATHTLSLPGLPQSARAIRNMVTLDQAGLDLMEGQFRKVFDTPETKNAMRYTGERLEQSAAWQLLNPEQQASSRQISDHLQAFGDVMEARGIIEQARQNYFPRILKPEFYNAFRGGGAEAAINRGAARFTKGRKFTGFVEELEDWLRSEGLDPAQVMEQDGVKTLMAHYRAGYKAIHNQSMREAMEGVGYLRLKSPEAPGNLGMSFVVPANGWRDVKDIRGLEGYEAPQEVKTLLEAMNKNGVPAGGIGRAYDALNGLMTKAIIYNPYIHGWNLWRARLFAGVGKDAYMRSVEATQRGDASVLENARYGALVTARHFDTNHLSNSLDALIVKAGGPQTITGKALGGINQFAAWSDKKVFGEMIPATVNAVMEVEKLKWATKTGFKFGPGSPEYELAMNRIADYANNVGGRLPTVFRSQGASDAMRRVFLAPQWLETRWNLTKEALKDADPILTGGVPSGDPLYGKMKVRQLVIGASFVTGMSYLLSGKPPGFNPNTGRLYIRTGATDARDREIGFDPLGFGQDDFRMFAHPWDFLGGKLSPPITLAGEVKSGRDYRGNQLSTPEAVENALQHLGGIPQGVEALGRVAATGQLPTAVDATRDVLGTVGLGGISSLPTTQDAQMSAQAAKTLRDSGIPPTQDRVWDIQKVMRTSLARTGNIFKDNGVAYYVAGEQRSLAGKHSGTWLWYHLQQMLPGWTQ